jgi:primosomal protein N' (replication factor Y)
MWQSDGLARRASDLAVEAGVSAGVVKGLQEQGALKPVTLPALAPFRDPEPGHNPVTLSAAQEGSSALLARGSDGARVFRVAT